MRNAAVVVTIALSAGCSRPAAEQVAVFDACGYHIEVRSADYANRSIDARCSGSGDARTDDVTLKLDRHTLRIAGGVLTLDDRDRGAVEPGDRILLTGGGRVTVNGENR